MVSIELTPQQAEELKNFYISELEKIQTRSDIIKEIIIKLDIEYAPISLPEVVQVNKKASKEIISQDEKEIKNPKWNDFIIQVLQEAQKPLSSKALIKLYSKQYKEHIVKPETLKFNLAQSLYVMRVKTKQIQSIKIIGENEKLYGLTEWDIESTLKTKPKKQIKTIINEPEVPFVLDNATSSKAPFKWSQVIKEILIKQKRILTLNEILLYAMKHFEINANKKRATRGSISTTINYLKKKKRLIKPIQKKGIRGMSYGLLEWFDDDGKLIVEYK